MAPEHRLTRRQIILGMGVAVLGVTLPGLGRAQGHPEKTWTLRARPGLAALRHGGPQTRIWGYDAITPGPTLRIKRGDELRVHLVNELPEPTTVHWHGLRLPNAMDGVPGLTQAAVSPGSSFDYRFIPPDAGTFWYHPPVSATQPRGRGLAGLLIVDEPEPIDVDRDAALVFDDWRLTPDGDIDEASLGSLPNAAQAGRLGNHLTVNGRPGLDIPVRAGERIRLRLANIAHARLMTIRIDQHEVRVMALDGQPCEPFPARNASVVLGPGMRADLFIDATLAPGRSTPILLSGYGEDHPIARLVYSQSDPARIDPLPEPKPLPANPLPSRMDFARAFRRDMPIDGGAAGGRMGPGGGNASGTRVWNLAGQSSHHGVPLFTVKRGRTVMLSFPNHTAFLHAVHVHGHHFRLLDRLDDGWKPFWLDTVLVAPMQTTRIALVADNPGKWMIHCHMLEHHEAGMGAWFEVL